MIIKGYSLKKDPAGGYFIRQGNKARGFLTVTHVAILADALNWINARVAGEGEK